MRKFLLLLTTVFFIISLPAIGQSTDKQKTSFGIKTGVNVSKLNLNGNSSDLINSDYRTGFVAGAFVNIPIRKFLSLFNPSFFIHPWGEICQLN
jgi:hypothetical protein